MFEPRTKKWRTDKMRALKNDKIEFGFPERLEKIEALKRLK
jgi:hypothetical protein